MLWWNFKQQWKITVITCVSPNTKLLKVPFSSSKYRSLAFILMGRYLLFRFGLPFSSQWTYKRLVQLTRVSRYSPGILKCLYALLIPLCTLSHCLIHTIAENCSFTERRFRHLEKTVLGKYLLSYHTVSKGCWKIWLSFAGASFWSQ